MSSITLDYASPDESLRGHLSLFYDFHADVPVFEDKERADHAQFRFLLAGTNGTYTFHDGHVAKGATVQIVGPTTGPCYSRIDGPVHVFGVGLLPSGWAHLLDFEASLLLNRAIDACDLFGPDLLGVAEQIRRAGSIDERVKIGNALAHQLIAGGRGAAAAFAFTRVVDDWLASSPSPDVDELVRVLGLSRRQVERNCKRYYGSPPKVLSRKYRALKAAIALAKGEAAAADLLDDGFYDQSHFIREIKQFTGVTPKRIIEDLPTLATLTLKRSVFADREPVIIRA